MEAINALYEESEEKQLQLTRSLEASASRLHSLLVREVKGLRHDIFHRDFDSRRQDAIVTQSLAIASADRQRRDRLGGPSIRRQKFRAAYWKHWHKEKTLLDRISQEELLRLEEEEEERLRKSSPKRQKQKQRGGGGGGGAAGGGGGGGSRGKLFFGLDLLGEGAAPRVLMRDSLGVQPADEAAMDSSFNKVFPAKSVAIGGSGGGGPGCSFSQSSRLLGRQRAVTQSCDIPPLPSAFDPSPAAVGSGGLVAFASSAKRFERAAAAGPAGPAAPRSSRSSPAVEATRPSVIAGRQGFRFAHAPRLEEEKESNGLNATPGPGAYDQTRLFEARLPPLQPSSSSSSSNPTASSHANKVTHGLHDWTAQDLCEAGCLGQGCDVSQHILLGRCVDGQCLRRALSERAAVAAGDLKRVAGYRHGLPEADLAVTALYAAVALNDLPTLHRLGDLQINPNIPQKDTGYTPLHIGVIKKHRQAVYLLLHYFHYEESDKDDVTQQNQKQTNQMKTIRRKNSWLDVNAKDNYGNTALHYASRLGDEEIVAMLCGERETAVDICNAHGETALDLAPSHPHAVFSFLKLAQERDNLRRRLQQTGTTSTS
eukprot:gene7785-8596_t